MTMPPNVKSAMPGDLAARAEAWFDFRRFAVVLAVLFLAAFPGVLVGVNSFFFRDFSTLAYPFVHYQRECFWRGELPLWNPLSHCGVPFLAQWNTLGCYPFSLIYLVFPLPQSLNFFCLAHLYWAGLGMYWLAVQWSRNRWAAAMAGVGYAFSGLTLASHIFPNYLVTLAWMPWTVGLTDRAWREGGRILVLAILAGTMQMLSGAPELILQTWLLIGVLWLAAMVRGEAPRLAMAQRFLAAVVLVAGLSAVQLLPFFSLLANSHRDLGTASQFWSLPGWGWANLLVPLFHCFRTPQGVYFQAGQVFLGSCYVGAGLLALAILGAGRTRDPRRWVLAGMAALSLILALGQQGYLHGWLARVLPWLGLTRYPIKFIYLAGFIVPLLAACGAASLGAKVIEARRDLRSAAVVALVFLCLVGGLAWFAWRYPYPGEDWVRTVQSAGSRVVLLTALLAVVATRGLWSTLRFSLVAHLGALLVVWLDLQTHLPHLTPTIGSSAYTAQVVELAPKPAFGQSRVMTSPRAERLLMTRTLPDFLEDFLGSRLAMWSNLNVLEGVPKVGGAATLQLREQAELEALLYGSPTNDFPRLADFLGVSHVSSPANPVEWMARTNFLPLITAGQTPVFVEAPQTIAALFAPDFRPDQVVYLPKEAELLAKAARPTSVRVKMTTAFARRLEALVEADTPTMVVIAQSYHPGWRAHVDRKPARLWRANHAFQALAVPAGKHTIRLVYREERLTLGAILSALALGACAGVWWRNKLPAVRFEPASAPKHPAGPSER